MIYRELLTILISITVLLTGCSGRPAITAEYSAWEETEKTSVSERPAETVSVPELTEMSGITVFVCGAVRNPGVYTLPVDARAADAVEAAAGFAEDADRECENLARLLTDGERLRIPTLTETAAWNEAGLREDVSSAEVHSGSSVTQESSAVNINTAGKEELMTLRGIGESRALDIIAYRELNGPFASVSDIRKVSGIGDAIFARIRDRITV